MKNLILVIIYFIFIGCNPIAKNSSWGGGKITEPGIYVHSDESLTVNIYLENTFVKYKVNDKEGQRLC
ncbi:MAG: hypothetical protein ABI663_03875 [Chryseolinea sp.]